MKFFLGIFFLIGAYLIGVSLLAGADIISAQNWATANGKIEETTFMITGSRPSTTAEQVSYSYQVNGQTYESDRVYFGLTISDNKSPVRYQKDEHVYVYYDPTNPGNSVLQPNDTHSIMLGGIGGMVFIAFSLFGYWLQRRKSSAEQ